MDAKSKTEMNDLIFFIAKLFIYFTVCEHKSYLIACSSFCVYVYHLLQYVALLAMLLKFSGVFVDLFLFKIMFNL